MNVIDFMNNKKYDKNPGNEADLKSHPKIIIIKKDGTILYSDTSNDGKRVMAFGEEIRCDTHTDYIKVLVDRFYSDNEEMVSNAKKESLHDNMRNFIEEGEIMFSNTTTYIGPRFYINGICGLFLIPSTGITPNQIEALAKLEPYTSYFKEITIQETKTKKVGKNFDLDPTSQIIDSGKQAIKNYIGQKLVHPNNQIKSKIKKRTKTKIS